MSFDKDILYFGTLFLCIAMGQFYKQLDDAELKRNYGAGLGFLVTCLVCRQYALYTLVLVWGNIMIIKCSDKRYVNQLSISFSWMLLVYIASMVGPESYTMYINQMLALRLVGLASEINKLEYSRLSRLDLVSKVSSHAQKSTVSNVNNNITMQPEDAKLLELTAIDVCAYAYHFIGIHKGPYYRYREYAYHFNSPFSKLGQFRVITAEKLKKVLLYIAGYALLRIKFSTQIFYQENFYKNDYNMELRFLYNIPLLMMYVLSHEIMVMLSTCVFTEAGFGVYPALCAAVPGHGPTVNEHLLLPTSEAVVNAPDFEYNFTILRCFENKRLIIGPKMRDTIKSWDIATKYWFFTYVYSNLPNLRKEVRSAAAFTAWSVWMGLSLPHFIFVATLWVWVNLEHEFGVMYNTNDSSVRSAWNIGFSIMRILCFLYLTPCLVISDTLAVLKFYNSICWMLHIVTLGLIVLAIALFKVRVNT